MPRWRLYQACKAGAFLALKKMPPMPVTRFISTSMRVVGLQEVIPLQGPPVIGPSATAATGLRSWRRWRVERDAMACFVADPWSARIFLLAAALLGGCGRDR